MSIIASPTPQETGRPPWTVRYTWLVPDGSSHPTRTYAEHGSENSAIDHAVGTLDNQTPDDPLRIFCAHVKLPEGRWRQIEWQP